MSRCMSPHLAVIRSRAHTWLALALIPAAIGCGTGATGQAARPVERTAAEALGEPTSSGCQVGDNDQPLVVDWKAHERSNLEEAMQDGVAVVAYDCNSLRLLRSCRVDGGYAFLGTSKKEELVRLNDADEVKTNLPSSAPSWRTSSRRSCREGRPSISPWFSSASAAPRTPRWTGASSSVAQLAPARLTSCAERSSARSPWVPGRRGRSPRRPTS